MQRRTNRPYWTGLLAIIGAVAFAAPVRGQQAVAYVDVAHIINS